MIEIDVLPVHPVTGMTAIGMLKSGRPVWPVLGGADDDDQDDDAGNDDDGQDDADDDGQDGGQGGAGGQDDDRDDEGQDDDEDPPLGPKGEKALQREKERRREEARRRRAAEAELAKLRNGEGNDDDRTRREAEQAATAKANARILRSEIKAAAAGKLADPRDALRFLDLDEFDVGTDGEVDEDAVADAIDELLKAKPYLAAQAAQGGKRFQGTGDGGRRPKPPKPRPKSLGEAVARRIKN